MTYIMDPGDPNKIDVYDLARRMSPCDCSEEVPIAVEITTANQPLRDFYGNEVPFELGTYCIRCQKRGLIQAYFDDLVEVPDMAMVQIRSIMPCQHYHSWEITAALRQKGERSVAYSRMQRLHLLYCRTCRKVYRIQLAYDISVFRT